MSEPIGILGGTFDPVHFGHLRTALELVESLGMQRLVLVPVGEPPHRQSPLAPAADRLAMLELAVASEPRLTVDDREIRRPGPSYSVDTLRSFREELGAERPLLLCIGADSWLSVDSWSRYLQLPDHAHVVVISRPGWEQHARRGPDRFSSRWVKSTRALKMAAAGMIYTETVTPLDISATRIRELVASGRSARYLLPDAVWSYIEQHGLYRHTR